MRMIIQTIAFAIITTLGISNSLGSVITVPDDHLTIQEGINAAQNGDTVLVDDGIYTGNNNRSLSFNGKAIIVKSINGPENCIIDCEGSWDYPRRGITFFNGESPEAVFSGFTIQNGFVRWGSGGAIHVGYSSSPVIANCRLQNNRAEYGGAISCGSNSGDDSSPSFINCIVFENTAKFSGNAVYSRINTTVNLTNCTFSKNDFSSSGVIYASGNSSIQIMNTIIWGNNTDSFIAFGSESSITKEYSNFPETDLNNNNIAEDPVFMDPDNKDFHLDLSSPCIDKGRLDPLNPYYFTDIDGDKRPQGYKIDIGADEILKTDFDSDDDIDGTDLADFALQYGTDFGLEELAVFATLFGRDGGPVAE
jgi:hypothetical protein